MLSESNLEELVYLHFIRQANSKAVNFVELGAGHGFQSMRFLMCIEKVKKCTKIEEVYYVLVEAYPPHFQRLLENWWKRNYRIIFGAVSAQSGRARFLTEWDGCQGENFWGGVISSVGSLEVQTYTLNDILEMAGIEHISFLHMDVQGEEERIVDHCSDLASHAKLDAVYIGTHGNERHERVKQKLSTYIPLKIDALPNSISTTPLGTVQTRDGILFFSNSVHFN